MLRLVNSFGAVTRCRFSKMFFGAERGLVLVMPLGSHTRICLACPMEYSRAAWMWIESGSTLLITTHQSRNDRYRELAPDGSFANGPFPICVAEVPFVPQSILEAIRLGDWTFEPNHNHDSVSDMEPTSAKPGSEEKVAVLADRVRRGLPLWHPRDLSLNRREH